MEPLSNLFRDLPASLAAELVDVLVDAPGVKLERIVSLGHATPPGEWYDQETNECVEPPACRGVPRDVASYAEDVP